MEILNKNQRASAIWRLFALGIVILGLVAASLYGTHTNYTAQWKLDELRLRRKFELDRDSLDKALQALHTEQQEMAPKVADLQKKLEECEGENKTLAKSEKQCKEDYKDCQQKLLMSAILNKEN